MYPAWTANDKVPWIAPTIGVGLLMIGCYTIMQSTLVYLPLPVLNTLLRSLQQTTSPAAPSLQSVLSLPGQCLRAWELRRAAAYWQG